MAKLAGIPCLLIIACVLGGTSTGWSKGPKCNRCGCSEVLRECRLVPSSKRVTTDYFDSATESFCVPHMKGIWHVFGRHAESGKGERGHVPKTDGRVTCDDVASRYGAKPRQRNRLIRKKCTTEVPAARWVTWYVCCECGHAIDDNHPPIQGKSSVGKRPYPADPPPAIPLPPSLKDLSNRRAAIALGSEK